MSKTKVKPDRVRPAQSVFTREEIETMKHPQLIDLKLWGSVYEKLQAERVMNEKGWKHEHLANRI